MVVERRARQSIALGNIKTITLNDLQTNINSTIITKNGIDQKQPIRVLVTVHSVKLGLGDLYERGLGLWVGYIIQKYLKVRGVKFRLYMKSILESTKLKSVVGFIKKNKIDYLIPSDVTDTMFVSKYWHEINATGVKFCITPSLSVYEHLEDKWETYQMMTEFQIPTPKTVKYDTELKIEDQPYPFFLKVASGTNAGRGVWHCTNTKELEEALQTKEVKYRGDDNLLLVQTPTYGDIVCAEVIYNHGKPLGFFFAQSVNAEDLAGMGSSYVNSQDAEYKQKHSHQKVILTDEQWESVTKIFHQLGKETKYHGMIDIEFIIAGDNNPQAEPGSLWLLECNPRFSGDIHTTLSNPGFLDLYFQVMNGTIPDTMGCGNYSVGVDMKSTFGNYYPTQFYVSNPLNVLSIRHWHTHNYCVWDPAKHKDYASKDPLTASLTSSLTATEDMTASQVEKVVAEAEYPDFGENDDLDLKLRIP